MCLIFISLNNHPTYKLVVAANRDEFYKRKTAPAHFWQEHNEILGGRDLEAGGTWLAMTKGGKIGMVTNYRDPKNIDPKAPSRGQLVTDSLLFNGITEDYLHDVATRAKQYNGFNLIAGSVDALWYLSNYGNGVYQIPHGNHGLSNHLLDTPWPKVKKGMAKFNDVLRASTIAPAALFDLLFDDEMAADDLLPDTGVGLQRERVLSSMFIKSPGYGTRCSTVILVNKKNEVLFSERVYDTTTFDYTTQTFEFAIE